LEGFQPYQARRLIYGARIDDPDEQKQILGIVGRLYDAFIGADAMLCEINPLIVTPDGEVKALDSKFTVDDSALYKHADIAEMRDLEAYPPEERAAREKGVTYVKLDGEVGILGNGAGLVMSTLDVIALAGGRPANFCDLGRGGDAQGVVDALEVVTADPQVRAIPVNIFGCIPRREAVAPARRGGRARRGRDGARRRERRRPCRAAAARRGLRGCDARPVARDAGGRARARRAHPVRRRRLRRRRHADRAAPLRGHPRGGRRAR